MSAKTALISRCGAFDVASAYLTEFGVKLVAYAKEQGYTVTELYNDDPLLPAREATFTTEIQKKPSLFIGLGHGGNSVFTGMDKEILLQAGVNDDLTGGIPSYLWGCHTATTLGPDMVSKACPVYFGYACVSEDTDILTSNGWKTIDTISENDKALSFDTKTNELKFVSIRQIFRYNYSPPNHQNVMYHFGNKRTDQLVTPNHGVLYIPQQSTKVKKKCAKTVFVKHTTENLRIPIAGNYVGVDYPISDQEICLWAWILSEGSVRRGKNKGKGDRVKIYQSVKHTDYVKRIREVLTTNKIVWAEHSYSGTHLSTIPVIHFTFYRNGFSKVMPDWLLGLSKRQARIFLEEYRKGDGDRRNFIIHTAKIRDVEIITALAVLAGWLFRVRTFQSLNPYNRELLGVIHRISIITENHNNMSWLKPRKVMNYKGRVWCINTELGTFVCRRNGLVAITGNSDWTFNYHPDYVNVASSDNPPADEKCILNDPYARAFFDAGLATGYSLLLGKTPQEIYKDTIDRYDYWWNYWLKQDDATADSVLTQIANDRDNFMVITSTGIYQEPPPGGEFAGIPLGSLIPIAGAAALLFFLTR